MEKNEKTAVFHSDFQNRPSVSTSTKLSSPTQSYLSISGFQSCRLPAKALKIGYAMKTAK